ncbi:T9SS type A sorting domain-containing protein [Labilibacter marinus]|uniref:T9SS type A sorting domain-containing protein n=1 Tax=Labilibacter marinus TaxID=1477105 RepID=UPI0009F97BCD|nr:T9SS type A sorting domain-containing protein [Labilibacter marinus]
MQNSTNRISLMLLFACFVVSINAQQTHHVYSTDIPWSDTTPSEEAGKMYSITDAIAAASSGDIILVHEGIYREKIVVNKNNLQIKSFENDYVLVSGAEIVDGWTEATGMHEGVQVADISGFDIETDYTQLFADGNSQMMARHPNNKTGDMMDPMNIKSGYAPLSNVHKDAGENATGRATLDDTTLPNVDLTGGIFRGLTGKMRQYVYGNITSSYGNTVSFNAMNNGEWKAEAGFNNTKHKFSWGFVMHKNLIDYPGEWYADGDELYYLPLNKETFEDTRIEIQVRERVLVLNNTSGVTIKGIHFVAGNMDIQNATGATIESGSIRYVHPLWIPKGYGQGDSDPKGIYLRNSSNNTFKDLHVAHSWGNMFSVRDGEGNSFQNCIIEDFGWVGIFTSGVHINTSDKTNINNCTFGDACRFQIRIDGNDAQVNIMDCDFYGSMKLGEDAGPIEATSTGKIGTINLKDSEIAYNKVHDVVGVPVSSFNYKRVKATAFYMEDVENYTAHHNLIYNIKHTVEHDFEIEPVGEFLYLGPRYNAMHHPVNYYNNTIWNVDENIGIWNIAIANWQELGLAESENTGMMDDGHFANNIFMNGPGYKLSYTTQKITSTGGKVSWEDSPAGSSITTHDFNAYVNHSANWGYHFNPENNQFFDFAAAGTHFEDAANGDFTLKAGSAAKGAGAELTGYTSSTTPDCGALEGSDRVLNAGATISIPDYKEVSEIIPDDDSAVNPIIRDNTVIFPNPVSDVLYVKNSMVDFNAHALSIYTVSGKKVSNPNLIQRAGEALQVDVSHLPTGMYFARIEDEGEAYHFKFIKK